MSRRLSEAEMLKLVHIYKYHEVLWNTTHHSYKKRHARINAYMEIAEQLNVPGVAMHDIPNKIKNLRTSYYQELKKISRSLCYGTDSESVYTPKVAWFTILDGFLKPFIGAEYISIGDDPLNITDSDNDSVTTKMEPIQPNEKKKSSNNINTEVHVKMEDLDPLENIENSPESNANSIENFESSPKSNVRNESPPPLLPKKRKVLRPVIKKIYSGAKPRINRAASLLRTSNSLRNADEFDEFGSYVAAILRGLPQETSIVAKTEIQMTLQAIQLRALKQAQGKK